MGYFRLRSTRPGQRKVLSLDLEFRSVDYGFGPYAGILVRYWSLVVQSIEIDLLSSVDDSLHYVTSYASISQARKALGCANLMCTYICGRRLRRLVIYMYRLY